MWLPVAAAKSLPSFPTLCDPIDGSPPGSPVPGILQARALEWAAIAFSNVWKWKLKVKSLSRVWLLETPWTAAHQAPPSTGFSRQENWTGVLLPSPHMAARCVKRCSWKEDVKEKKSHLPPSHFPVSTSTSEWLSLTRSQSTVQFSRVQLFATPWTAARRQISQ